MTLSFEAVWWIVVLSWMFSSRTSESIQIGLLHPNYTWFWLIIPLIIAGTFVYWHWKISIYKQFHGTGKTRILWNPFHPFRAFIQYFLLRTFIFLIVLAVAEPVLGKTKIKSSKRVLDLVICLDISNSMNVQDMKNGVSRLTAAKATISELLNQLKGERIAVVVFANDAFVQLPLTMDYGAAKLFVPDIETSMLSDQGTNIGNALAVAQTQFKDTESGKAILVLTDGEDHEQKWQSEVKKLRDLKVRQYYLGFGSSEGGLVPIDPYDLSLGYKRVNGKAVVSKLNSGTIHQMAKNSGAEYSTTRQEFPSVSPIVEMLNSSQQQKVQSVEVTVDQTYFQIPTILAIICFLAFLFVPLAINRSSHA
jgi:Ca-activated chloride channel family protein